MSATPRHQALSHIRHKNSRRAACSEQYSIRVRPPHPLCFFLTRRQAIFRIRQPRRKTKTRQRRPKFSALRPHHRAHTVASGQPAAHGKQRGISPANRGVSACGFPYQQAKPTLVKQAVKTRRERSVTTIGSPYPDNLERW